MVKQQAAIRKDFQIPSIKIFVKILVMLIKEYKEKSY